VHIRGAWPGHEGRVQNVGAPKEKEDGGSPSGGGEELIIVYGLMQLQVNISLGHLARSFKRRWTYPSFVPPPLGIFNSEENTADSEEIGVEEREEAERSDKTSEE
jgi:hypothetical protein